MFFGRDQQTDHGDEKTGAQHAVTQISALFFGGKHLVFVSGKEQCQHQNERQFSNLGRLKREGPEHQPAPGAAPHRSDEKHQEQEEKRNTVKRHAEKPPEFRRGKKNKRQRRKD